MVEYIAGVYKNGSFTNIPQPIENMHGYWGYGIQDIPTFKGKLDYNGNLWTLTCNNADNPTVMYLVKIHDNGDGTFTVDYNQLPVYNDGAVNIVPHPTQLTVDKYGNVYLDFGIYYSGGLFRPHTYAIIAKVTPADFAVPLTSSIYNTINTGGNSINATLCVCLNKAHTKLVTYLWNYSTYTPGILEINTNSMTLSAFEMMGAQELGKGAVPINIENTIGGVNDNIAWMFLGRGSSGRIRIAAWDFTNQDWDVVTNDFVDAQATMYAMGLAIDNNGNVIVANWDNLCNPNTPNRLFTLAPTETRGVLDTPVMTSLDCIVPIEGGGNTTGMGWLQHHDINRVDNSDWIGGGNNVFFPVSGQIYGDVRRITPTSQVVKSVIVDEYLYPFTAGKREGHN